LPFKTSYFKTIFSPATVDLIAYTIVGGAIAVEISFFQLDSFDQFGLEKVIGSNTVHFGQGPHFRDFHGSFPFRVALTVQVQDGNHENSAFIGLCHRAAT
jgi:hypothetical protein